MKGKHKGMDWTIIIAAVLGAMIVYALEGCTPIKDNLTESNIPLVKFSAQNQMEKQGNAMALIEREGRMLYDVYFGLKCSEDGKARSYIWLSQVEMDPNDTKINVLEENC
jgi:hypothetical protein